MPCTGVHCKCKDCQELMDWSAFLHSRPNPFLEALEETDVKKHDTEKNLTRLEILRIT